MASNTKGVGHFTTDNIVAVLRALPETDGTYAQVLEQVREQGASVSQPTLSNWVTNGRADIKAGKRQTAYARFAQRYDSLMEEHCNADANRNRELDRAFEILDRTCECGNEKTTLADGTRADRCRQCQELDDTGRSRRRTRS